MHKEEIENVEHKDHKDDDDGDEFYKDDLDKMNMVVVAKMKTRRMALRVLRCIRRNWLQADSTSCQELKIEMEMRN